MNCYQVPDHAQEKHAIQRRDEGTIYGIPYSNGGRKPGRTRVVFINQPVRIYRKNWTEDFSSRSQLRKIGGILSQLADRYSQDLSEKLAEVDALQAKLREIQSLQAEVEADSSIEQSS